MLGRNEKGTLYIKSLDMQIFLGDLFEECLTRKEVEFLKNQIIETTECIADERLDDIK